MAVETSLEQIANLLHEGGDQALLDLKGFGRKGLIDVKEASSCSGLRGSRSRVAFPTYIAFRGAASCNR